VQGKQVKMAEYLYLFQSVHYNSANNKTLMENPNNFIQGKNLVDDIIGYRLLCHVALFY